MVFVLQTVGCAMKKPPKKISVRVLKTELAITIEYMDAHNFGFAKRSIEQILARVKEYDLSVDKANSY